MAFKQLKLWFDEALASMLANKLLDHGVKFDSKSFIDAVRDGVGELELKDRVELIADEMYEKLPGDYIAKIHVLREILGPENDAETGMFKEFYWLMPIAKIVEKYGLDHYEESLHTMLEVTKRNTSEYAIRPFAERYGNRLLEDLQQLAKHENFHIRRLCVEGVRPRLPWARKLTQFIIDPTPLLPILELLKDDPVKYVQKSVANCLNDILKDNPEIAKKVLTRWAKKPSKQCQWIIKHAMRNSLKNKEQWAMDLL